MLPVAIALAQPGQHILALWLVKLQRCPCAAARTHADSHQKGF